MPFLDSIPPGFQKVGLAEQPSMLQNNPLLVQGRDFIVESGVAYRIVAVEQKVADIQK